MADCPLCGTSVCPPLPHTQIQVGGDEATPIHPECGLRMALGGIGHLTDHDYWCTQMHDPDMGLSPYESALAVQRWVISTHGARGA